MQWSDEFSLGIQEIDDQHKRLIEIFARINDAIRNGMGWSDIHYGIVELMDFTRMHFAFEEALMRLYGYPQTGQHGLEHQAFKRKMREIENESLKQRPTDEELQELQRLSCNWLKEHILRADKAYADHMLAGAMMVVSARQ